MTVKAQFNERAQTERLFAGTDGASGLDGYPAAENRVRNALFQKYHKETGNLRSWPFIDGRYAGDIWKIPFEWVLSEVFKYFDESTEGHPNTGMQTINGLFDMGRTFFRQLYSTHLNSSMPKIAAWKGFAAGQSRMPNMYSIDVGDHVLPVFDYETDHVKLIKKNFAITSDGAKVISTFNGKLGRYIKPSWTLAAAQKYTRGDYRELIDAPKANDWFARDYTWDMQQFGPITNTTTVGPFTVKEYGRPGKLGTFIRNLVGDKLYDLFDMPWDALGPAGFGILPPITGQGFKDRQYKSIATARRALIQTSRKNLIYDLEVSYVMAHAPQIIAILTS